MTPRRILTQASLLVIAALCMVALVVLWAVQGEWEKALGVTAALAFFFGTLGAGKRSR